MGRSLRWALLSLLSGVAVSARAQTREVRGHVTDAETSQPLVAVEVLEKGTLRGTHTRDDGTYTLTVPAGALTLTFRRIGYKQSEQTLTADQGTADVTLQRDVLKLEETIITGQATGESRRNVANAVSTVSADELTHVQAQTIEQSLQGKVAGADIQANSGAPGGGYQVRLRGISSIIGASDPLFVVDGVIISNAAIASGQNSITKATSGAAGGSGIASNQDNPSNRLADLDPNDIESIEVLKGASASAIYGSKASQGVVLITTKRGRAGKPQFRATQRFGFSELSNEIGARTFPTLASAEAAFGSRAAAYYKPGVTYDHEQELAGHQPLSWQTTASVSGGNDNTQYYTSGILEHDGGIIQNTYFDKQSVILNLDQAVGSRINLGLGTTFSHTADGRGITNNDNTSTSFYATLPGVPNFVNLQQLGSGTYPNDPFAPSNPLQTAALLHNDESIYRFLGNGHGTLHVLSTTNNALNLLLVGGLDYFQQQNSLYSPPDLQYEILYGNPGTSVLSNTNNLFTNLNLSLVDIFTPGGGAFRATTSIGAQEETRYQSLSRTEAKNLAGTLQNINRGTNVTVDEQRQNTVDEGLFAQEEFLTLEDRLLLTVGLRADRSSNNANTDKLFYYPKGSASYRLTVGHSILDDIKFRAAVGESGNEPLYGQKFGELVAANYAGIPTSQVLGSISASDLRPERQLEVEGGFDATLFDSRMTFSVTGYQKHISDLLLQRTLAGATGFQNEFFNSGTLRTRGIEIEATADAIQRRDMQVTLNANFSKDASVVTALPVPSFIPANQGFSTTFGTAWIQEGRSPSEIEGNVVHNGTVTTGAIGDANPDFRVGWGATGAYHHFHLSFLFNWVQGASVVNLTELLYDFAQNSPDYGNPIVVNGKATTVGANRLARWEAGNGNVYVQDGSFVKLRELTLSWDIPSRWLSFMGPSVSNATLSVSGRNLVTWTKYPGLDPEVSNFGNQNVGRNVDVGPFPPSRTFWFGLSLGF
ncbi:MAG TPA: SusC/RagA family TonB-linked outer membrane protein [Vicinamibacterales bacterium]|jgi:TonB-linked SusC/RagA family outer membrane protein|nr:SusC/RagA family TonB-linked outer membrane protein [Vicinamibacterales bacterium]